MIIVNNLSLLVAVRSITSCISKKEVKSSFNEICLIGSLMVITLK